MGPRERDVIDLAIKVFEVETNIRTRAQTFGDQKGVDIIHLK